VHNGRGIGPENLFALRSNNSRLVSFEIDLDKLPLKLLNANCRTWILGIATTDDMGNTPEKLFLERLRVTRFVHASM